MILLVGPLGDPGVAYLAARLGEREEPICLAEPAALRERWGLTLVADDGGTSGAVRHAGRRIDLGAIRSVYLRRTALLTAPAGAAPDEHDHAWRAVFASIGALVINRPLAAASNASKPLQLRRIAGFGFAVPRTLVSNVSTDVRRFYDECAGRVVYKSASGRRSIVRRLGAGDLARLDSLGPCPVQFQEYLAGDDLRVHVVGERVFAAEIRSDATDYRYVDRAGSYREIRAAELPAEIAERCRRLSRGLGLVVSGIDLRRSPEGEYYCFEANPSPDFVFYQRATGQPIGEAIADRLCAGLP